MIIIKGIKFKFKKINKVDDNKKVKTNQKIEWIGLIDVIVINTEKRINIVKMLNISFTLGYVNFK